MAKSIKDKKIKEPVIAVKGNFIDIMKAAGKNATKNSKPKKK